MSSNNHPEPLLKSLDIPSPQLDTKLLPLSDFLATNKYNYDISIHPLVQAAKNNDIKVVHHYIQYCKQESPDTPLDLEAVCDARVKPSRPIVYGVTPLWMAAACGNLGMVKFLVCNGADVNHCTKTGSSPLRGACFYGHLDIVKYLFANNGSIDMPNQWGNTPLMISAYRKHLSVVKFLLDNGVEKNASSFYGEERGNNALHEACAGGDLNITQELYNNGVVYTTNEHGMTPAIIAASEAMLEPLEYFLSTGVCTGTEAVNALELAGSSVIMRRHLISDSSQMSKSYPYYYRAHAIMKQMNTFTRYPPTPSPNSAYLGVQSFSDISSLHLLNTDFIHNSMYALMVRERVTSQEHFHTANDTRYAALLYQATGNTQLGLDLALYNLIINSKYRSGSQCFCDSLAISVSFLEKEYIYMQTEGLSLLPFVTVAFEGVERMYNESVGNMLHNDFDEQSPNREQSIILTLLNMLALLAASTEHNQHDFSICVDYCRRLCKLPISCSIISDRLLHYLCACNKAPLIEKVHEYTLISLSRYRAQLVRAVISSGYNIDLRDEWGNNALHIATSDYIFGDPDVQFLLITELILAGVHIDTRNIYDKPALHWYFDYTKLFLKHGYSNLNNFIKILPLKCLSARALALTRPPNTYLQCRLPPRVKEFFLLHTDTHSAYL